MPLSIVTACSCRARAHFSCENYAHRRSTADRERARLRRAPPASGSTLAARDRLLALIVVILLDAEEIDADEGSREGALEKARTRRIELAGEWTRPAAKTGRQPEKAGVSLRIHGHGARRPDSSARRSRTSRAAKNSPAL
jgi:hypothetical protein